MRASVWKSSGGSRGGGGCDPLPQFISCLLACRMKVPRDQLGDAGRVVPTIPPGDAC